MSTLSRRILRFFQPEEEQQRDEIRKHLEDAHGHVDEMLQTMSMNGAEFRRRLKIAITDPDKTVPN